MNIKRQIINEVLMKHQTLYQDIIQSDIPHTTVNCLCKENVDIEVIDEHPVIDPVENQDVMLLKDKHCLFEKV